MQFATHQNILFRTGNVYEGVYKDGKRADGKGKVTLANGNTFEGQFRNGVPSGEGIYYWNADGPHKGDRYEGQYHQGRRHGKGKFIGRTKRRQWKIGRKANNGSLLRSFTTN